MPLFTQIPVRDQTILLEECWSELFVITAAQYGFSIENVVLQPDDKTKRLQKAINQIIFHQIDQTEASCLKALVLFRPETASHLLSTVFPILDALDPNGFIMYRLVRDATHFVDGHHVKILDNLNRDLNKLTSRSGLIGLVAVCGIGAYKFKHRGEMSTSVFLMQLRVAAQGTVVGALSLGLAYTMANRFLFKTNDSNEK